MAANITISDDGSITAKQGTTLNWAYGLKSGVDVVDTTGYSLACHVRATYDSSSALLVLSTINGKVENQTASGTFVVTVDPADTTAIRVTGEELECVYDVELTHPDGYVDRIAEGTFTLTREVTR